MNLKSSFLSWKTKLTCVSKVTVNSKTLSSVSFNYVMNFYLWHFGFVIYQHLDTMSSQVYHLLHGEITLTNFSKTLLLFASISPPSLFSGGEGSCLSFLPSSCQGTGYFSTISLALLSLNIFYSQVIC